MEIVKNKAKYTGKGVIDQTVTYSVDPYTEVTERLVRRGNQAKVVEVEQKKKG